VWVIQAANISLSRQGRLSGVPTHGATGDQQPDAGGADIFRSGVEPSIGTMSKDSADSDGESRCPICSSPSSIAIITTGLAWFTP
jgi:hypothetical protein